MAKERPLTQLTFRLGVLGAMQEARYAEALAPSGLKPKHVALLGLLERDGADSQQEVARRMRIAPSLVVLLADQLEDLGAVDRVRDPLDRRRQNLTLTAEGHKMLATCTDLAVGLDEELVAPLTAADRAALRRIMAKLAVANDLPGDSY